MHGRVLASVLLTVLVLQTLCATDAKSFAAPSLEQLRWSQYEIGCIIHFNMRTFFPNISYDYLPAPKYFNPTQLSTDQWVQTCASFKAKYAVLVAKHDSGFALWPTKSYDIVNKKYSIQYTPYKNGQGDIVREFFQSCFKYGMRPGIYNSVATNFLMNVQSGRVRNRNETAQKIYNQIVITQMQEIWSLYGPLTEIWFDGGVLPVSQGGPDLVPLMRSLQPQAVVFNSPEAYPVNPIRWIGNENGLAPTPNWMPTDGMQPCSNGGDNSGSQTGDQWCPPECDTTLMTQDSWFWSPDGNPPLKSLDSLMSIYNTTVGRSCNLLMDVTPDNTGRVPQAFVQRYAQFGAEIHKRYSKSIASTRGVGHTINLKISSTGVQVDTILLQEDITLGQRVNEYVLFLRNQNGQWIQVAEGTSIGYKKIDDVDFARWNNKAYLATEMLLYVHQSLDIPVIANLAVYYVGIYDD